MSPRDYSSECSRLHGLAYRAAYPILGSREASQDVAQETLARAFARWNRIEEYAEAWVVRVAVNLSLDSTRARLLPRRWNPVAIAAPEISVADRVDLQRALVRLSNKQRQAVVLRYGLGLSEAEVALILNVSAGTVKTHLARGLRQLRSIMISQEET